MFSVYLIVMCIYIYIRIYKYTFTMYMITCGKYVHDIMFCDIAKYQLYIPSGKLT